MDQTFITIHNLTPNANILFASDSIVDILGYHPDEVQERSCFDFFHPHELPFARSIHSRGVLLDKAAVLQYARIMSKDGRWVSCECCFTIVHDVLVASTSVYRRGERSQRRALEAPQIRRMFASSPRDPRYNMLEYLSPKFKTPATEREPRAALILNRFTRTLRIMFATTAVSTILGLRPDQVQGQSFYDCIQDRCLDDALECLEGAKANDSIAYLRFWFRDPRQPDEVEAYGSDTNLDADNEEDGAADGMINKEAYHPMHESGNNGDSSRSSSGTDGVRTASTTDRAAHESQSSTSTPRIKTEGNDSGGSSPRAPPRQREGQVQEYPLPSIELEAVVSCTSDGLVVVLRKARPQIPTASAARVHRNVDQGLFAAPWAYVPAVPSFQDGMRNTRPAPTPYMRHTRDNVVRMGGPAHEQLMSSIRDVAVFAWALVGINESFAAYSRGTPLDEAVPCKDEIGQAHRSGFAEDTSMHWPSCSQEHAAGEACNELYQRSIMITSGSSVDAHSQQTRERRPPGQLRGAFFSSLQSSSHTTGRQRPKPPVHRAGGDGWRREPERSRSFGGRAEYPYPTPAKRREQRDIRRYRYD